MSNNKRRLSSSDDGERGNRQPQLQQQPRKRTRTTPEQLAVLEKTFQVNSTPNARVRDQLSRQLGMTDRSIQIWFQNRRAKEKNLAKRSTMAHDRMLRMQHYAASAAVAACHAMGSTQMDPQLYYYYYYFYFNQQLRQQSSTTAQNHAFATTPPPPPPPPLPPSASSSSSSPPSSVPFTPAPVPQQRSVLLPAPPPPPPPPPPTFMSVTPPPSASPKSRKMSLQRHFRAHSMGPYQSRFSNHVCQQQDQQQGPMRYQRGATMPVETTPLNASDFMGMLLSEEELTWSNSSDNAPANLNSILWHDVDGIQSVESLAPSTQANIAMNIANPMTVSNTTYTATATSASTTLNTAMHEFPVDTLQIGTWKRMMLQERDIQCHYDTVQHLMIWSIQDGLHAFKMQFSLDTIQSISMDLCSERPGIGRLRICLQSSDDNGISFYMFNNGAWTQCRDFTQDKQATQVHVHELFGPAMPLWSQWQVLAASVKGLNAKLSYLDPWYKNVAMYNGNVATSTTSSAPPTSHAQFVLS